MKGGRYGLDSTMPWTRLCLNQFGQSQKARFMGYRPTWPVSQSVFFEEPETLCGERY
jgi:hypothetical protein